MYRTMWRLDNRKPRMCVAAGMHSRADGVSESAHGLNIIYSSFCCKQHGRGVGGGCWQVLERTHPQQLRKVPDVLMKDLPLSACLPCGILQFLNLGAMLSLVLFTNSARTYSSTRVVLEYRCSLTQTPGATTTTTIDSGGSTTNQAGRATGDNKVKRPQPYGCRSRITDHCTIFLHKQTGNKYNIHNR